MKEFERLTAAMRSMNPSVNTDYVEGDLARVRDEMLLRMFSRTRYIADLVERAADLVERAQG